MSLTVFLSATPRARRFCLPELVGGFVAGMTDEQIAAGEAAIVALLLPSNNEVTAEEAPPHPNETVTLVARPTGRTYKDLPWWEVDVEESG